MTPELGSRYMVPDSVPALADPGASQTLVAASAATAAPAITADSRLRLLRTRWNTFVAFPELNGGIEFDAPEQGKGSCAHEDGGPEARAQYGFRIRQSGGRTTEWVLLRDGHRLHMPVPGTPSTSTHVDEWPEALPGLSTSGY